MEKQDDLELSYYAFLFISDTATSLLGILALSVVVWACIVRESVFVNAKPSFFLFETLAFCVSCTLPFMVVAGARGHNLFGKATDYIWFASKFALLHVAFQYSGLYKHAL